MMLLPRTLIVFWRSPRLDRLLAIGVLTLRKESPRFEFRYVEEVHLAIGQGFRAFLEFPTLGQAYVADELFPLFANRLMAESRPDYDWYLERHGLSREPGDDLALLLRTDGRRATDQVELFAIPIPEDGSSVLVSRFFVRGIDSIRDAEQVIARFPPPPAVTRLRPDPTNVRGMTIGLTTTDGSLIGYMPDYLVDDALKIVGDIEVPALIVVDKVNLPPAPTYHRLLCRFEIDSSRHPRWFDAERFRPLTCGVVPSAHA